jgi:hypothetical protein
MHRSGLKNGAHREPAKPKRHAEAERERIKREEDEVTINSDESFPASDPPSFSPGVTGANDVSKKKH